MMILYLIVVYLEGRIFMKNSSLVNKVLLSVLAAGTIGFTYSNDVQAASLNGKEIKDDVVTNATVDWRTPEGHGSCKFVMGQGNVSVQTNGSVGTVLKTLKEKGLRAALAPTYDGSEIKYAPITGLVGGEGQIDRGTIQALGILSEKKPVFKKVININTIKVPEDEKDYHDKFDNVIKNGNVQMQIGGNGSEPVIFGVVGGDLSIGANLNVNVGDSSMISSAPTSISRKGNVTINMDSGNVIGGVGGSTAVALGNIDAKATLLKVIKIDVITNGSTTTTLNGNIETNVKNGTNLAIFDNGGSAIAIGGRAESIVNGNTSLVIDSQVDAKKLEGITLGVAGAGVAVSSLGADAQSKVNGTSNVKVNNGVAIGLAGGGVAFASDAKVVGDKLTGRDIGDNDGKVDVTDEQLEKMLGINSGIPDCVINIHDVHQGGNATSTTKDTTIDFTGTTTAIGVVGGGVAGSYHKYTIKDEKIHGAIPEGHKLGDVIGESNAVANTGKTTININVAKKDGAPLTAEEKGEIIKAIKSFPGILKSKDSAELIKNLQTALGGLQDKGAVIGVFGGGAAISYTDTGAKATATNAGSEMNLNNGYVVAAFGNGVALANREAEANVKSTDKITMNVNGAEVVGLFGNGIAGHRKGDHGGSALVEAIDSEMNINNGSVDGVFGGGLAVQNLENNGAAQGTSKVITSGTSTINVASKVDKLTYGNLEGIFNKVGFGEHFKDVSELAKDAAIVGGGVAAGNGSYAEVNNSIINIENGAEVNGDVVAGGVAAINGESIVNDSTVNWNGGTISGALSGRGLGNNSTVKNSTLNVNGNVELTPLDNKNKISGFDKVNFAANTETTLKGLTAGNTTPLIDGNRSGVITVADGAKLNISELTKAEQSYLVAGNYNETSVFWDNSALTYDRTEGYAVAENKDGKYTVTYKELSNLTDKEQETAVNDMINSFGRNGRSIRGIIEGIITDGEHTTVGADEFFKDVTSNNIKDTDFAKGLLFGEVSGVSSTTVNAANDMAENAFLRLSLTQDTVNADAIDEDGAVWAKYLHNKHEVDNMGSSLGNLTSSNTYDGVTVGVDFAKKDNWQAGAAFSYVNGDGHGSAVNNDFDMWSLNLYSNLQKDDYNFIADLGYSKANHELNGSLFGKTLAADRDLAVWSAGVRAEKLYVNGNNQIVPYVGLRYMHVSADDYTTYYNRQAAFTNSCDNQNLWTLPVGVSLRNETVTASGWRFTPQADIAYIWAFGDTDNDVTVNTGSGASVLAYDVMDSGSWLGTLAIDAAKDNWSIGVGYSYQKGSDAENNKWFANVNYSF